MPSVICATALNSDGDTLSFGKHRFSVNRQELDLSMLQRDDEMVFHLAGTSYYHPVEDQNSDHQGLLDQDLISENDSVYRAEYLAWQILDAAEQGKEGISAAKLQDADFIDEHMLELVAASPANATKNNTSAVSTMPTPVKFLLADSPHPNL